MKLMTLVCLNLITFVASFALATHAQTFSVIHDFLGNAVDGGAPWAGVTLKNGVLYGTTNQGGNNCGTIYQITQSGSQWITVPLYVFKGGQFESDGCAPQARVVFGPDGHLYGTTFTGGGNQGVVFQLIPPLFPCKAIVCFWTEHILHTFGGEFDGGGPAFGDLIWDALGNIYGTNSYGGHGGAGHGTVFQMIENSWSETPIYIFGDNAGGPENGVILDNNGNLFGTVLGAGGQVFELTNIPGVGWQETVLHTMNPATDGITPYAGLIMDGSGNLYGATSTSGPGGAGTLFELSPQGNSWEFKVLYRFSGMPGCGPMQSLSMDSAGNIYGATRCTGASQSGTVFKLSLVNGQWVYTLVHDFVAFHNDGAQPISQVTIDTDGTLYGTTSAGGQEGWGTVWMIKP